MNTFKEGDIVRLKSGSPRLIVIYTRADGYVVVFWIGYGTHAPHEYTVPAVCLRHDGGAL